jgi:hypothetical protein
MDLLGIRLNEPPTRRLPRLLLAGALALGLAAMSASSAEAGGPFGPSHGPFGPPHGHSHGQPPGWLHHPRPSRTRVCTGTPEAPGTLAGVYFGTVFVEGVCAVNAGEARVFGNLIVRPDSALVAAFALDHETAGGSSSLSVAGNLLVQNGAAALLGCEAEHFPCIDDPNPEAPTLSSQDRIYGHLLGQQPLGIVAHNDVVFGSILQVGGGGGVTCEPSGIFTAFGSPVYSDYEDTAISGSLHVIGFNSCWLGVIRTHVGGSVHLINNQLADPDAIEILSNQIRGNLGCFHNSQVWNSADEGESLYPRSPQPNTVGGKRLGQCVLASPATEGGPLGPGPF